MNFTFWANFAQNAFFWSTPFAACPESDCKSAFVCFHSKRLQTRLQSGKKLASRDQALNLLTFGPKYAPYPMIQIDSYIHISELDKKDEAALVKWLNDEVIYRNTLRIPFPYRPEHARDFLQYAKTMQKEHRHATEWAIRNPAGELVGCVGFSRIYGKYAHKDEIGYWLAAPYRGKGIMTRVVAVVSDIGFRHFDLFRLEAPVFTYNPASGRVLEKCGFVCEGTLRNYVVKESRPMDVFMYTKVRAV